MAATTRGAAPVGYLADLDAVQAASVLYFRIWHDGPAAQFRLRTDLSAILGPEQARRALAALGLMVSLCAEHGRRPLIRHGQNCKCLGADESCFAHFIAAAADGAREDAMLMATLLVGANLVPTLTAAATEFGNALQQMRLANWQDPLPQPASQTRH